ncbi:hypothetical protein JCM4914_26550 [Streptomyces platensis subsp. malvinus]
MALLAQAGVVLSERYGASSRRRDGRTAARRSRIIDMGGLLHGPAVSAGAGRNAARNVDVHSFIGGTSAKRAALRAGC